MVFEKYYYRDGKKYGPYLYENKRVGDKIVTEYLGKKSDVDRKNHIRLFLFILIPLFVVALGFMSYNIYKPEFQAIYKTVTGHAVSEDASQSLDAPSSNSGSDSSISDSNSNSDSSNSLGDSQLETPSYNEPVVADQSVVEEQPPSVIAENSSDESSSNQDNILSENFSVSENQSQVSIQNNSDNYFENFSSNESSQVTVSEQVVNEIGSIGGGNISFVNNETNLTNVIIDVNATNETLLNNVLNETIINQTILINNSNNSIIQYSAELGKSVRWQKKIELSNEVTDGGLDVIFTVPAIADNISVLRVDGQTNSSTDITGEVQSGDDSKLVEASSTNSLTGNAVLEVYKKPLTISSFLKNILSAIGRFFQITGLVIDETTPQNIILTVNNVFDTNDSLVVEYYTPAPYSDEKNLSDFSKEITVVGPDEVHYTNILSYSDLPYAVSVDKILLYWINETSGEKQKVDFQIQDTDSNGLVNSIQWVVPHLSNQTYEIIILAVSAEHLDSSRNFVSDIYDSIASQDNNWSETINSGEYVRVGFERNLTNLNDITIYARSNNSASVEIYTKDETEKIAEISVTGEGLYKTYLTNLINTTDTFDLKSIGDIEYDYITDPSSVSAWVYQENSNATRDTGAFFFEVNYTKPTGATNSSLWLVKHGSLSPYNITIPSECWNAFSTVVAFRLYSNSNNGGGSAVSQPQCWNGTSAAWAGIGSTASEGVGGSGTAGSATLMTDGDWNTFNAWQQPGGWTITFSKEAPKWYEEAMWWYINDTAVPNFSNYTDNNATIAGSGIGLFNVTINNTNGTVLLNVNGVNITATPLISTNIAGTGGNITYDGNYAIHTFTSNGTFVPPVGVNNLTVLVVAGGGGGASGGGGAGGLIYNNSYSVDASSYAVVVGSGGNAGSGYGGATQPNNGQNSSFGTLNAAGGGKGAVNFNDGQSPFTGGSGGSGGGGGYSGATLTIGGSGTTGQGTSGGGNGNYLGNPYPSGGGGGAGAVGGNGTGNTVAGNGGAGLNYTINGSNVYYAGGGGGATWGAGTAGIGGNGGGGNGTSSSGTGKSGINGLGGGGGGVGNAGTGGAGGSGIVIVRYLAPTVTSIYGANYSFTSGGTYTYQWFAYGNGTFNIFNFSDTRNYTVYPPLNVTINSPVNNYNYSNVSSILFNVTSSESGTGFVVPNLDNSLVSWWRMDDNTSTTIIDYMGRYNGTVVGGATQNSSGKFGKSFSFDGSSGKINVSNVSSFDFGTGNFAIGLWTKPTNASKYQDFIGTDTDGKLMLSIGNTIDTKIYIGRNNIAFDTGCTNTLNSGVWNHLVVMKNNSYFSCYINGILTNAPISNANSYTFSNLIIGSIPQYGNWYGGDLDEFMIFNRSLSASEILSLYNATAMNFNMSLAGGTHNYTAYVGNVYGNINSSRVTFGIDNTYPGFSNYQDNNNTLNDVGLGLFNVTVLNTNGTVLLNINGVNVTATNSTYGGNIYNATYSFTSGGTYTYQWYAYGNDSNHNFNVSATRNYFVNAIPLVGITRIYPITNVNVSQNNFFNVTVNVSCLQGYCGTVNTSLQGNVSAWFYQEDANSTYEPSGFSSFEVNYTKLTNAVNSSLWLVKHGAFEPYNITIPSECWNAYSNKLRFRMVTTYNNGGGSSISYPLCWNGTLNDWSFIGQVAAEGSGGSGSFTSITNIVDGNWDTYVVGIGSGWMDGFDRNAPRWYEEAMWWNIASPILINTTTGATPFYTNSTNPLTTSALNIGQSQLITFWINATGIGGSTYIFNAFANSTSNLSVSNSTSSWNVTILDTAYPQFSNYSDNNISLSGSGIGRFNVTVLNTNGTVILNINGTNVTATNTTYGGNIYNATYNFVTNGTYNYQWYSWGSGRVHNFNISDTRNYFVNATPFVGLTQIYPITGVNVSQNNFFNVTVNVSCLQGYCGTVNTSLQANIDSHWQYQEVANSSTASTWYWVYVNYTKPVGAAAGSKWLVKHGSLAAYNITIPADCWNAYSDKVAFIMGGNTNNGGGAAWSDVACYNGTSTSNLFQSTYGYKDIGTYTSEGCCGTGAGAAPNLWNDSDWNTYNVWQQPGGWTTSSVSVAPRLYEEAMWWNISAAPSLVNTTAGATPFYTNSTNPLTTSALNIGQSQLITFWVNATGTVGATYIFNAFANSTLNLSVGNSTSSWNVTILDNIYPQFSNYSDNNVTLYLGGVGLFNVSVLNTNGTVILNINGTNVTATSLGSGIYNASYGLSTNGTYTYQWYSWGSGASHNFNISNSRNYTVLPPQCSNGLLGVGNSTNPCQITNWTTLNATKNYLNSYYILNNNLSSATSDYSGLGNNWTAIGNSTAPFTGNFNGQNYVINNLIINSTAFSDYVGLFGYVNGSAANLSNLGVINAYVDGFYNYVSPLVGILDGGARIYNCYTTGSLFGCGGVGGVIGQLNYGRVSYSYSSVNVTSYNCGDNNGGLVGYLGGGTDAQIINCYATGNVSSTGGKRCGGITALMVGSTLISGSYATGLITTSGNIGGLVASSSGTNISVSNSYWDANTTGTTSGSGTWKTTAQMRNISTYSGWNISASLSFSNKGYPYFGWQVSNNSVDWLMYNDTFYPQFYNYSDNNMSLTGGGIGLFNVTIDNTNGTVLLNINNTNVTATNISANIYTANYIFGANGTYPYQWYSFGNGSYNNLNVSATRNYFVAPPLNVTINSPANNSYFNYTSILFNVTSSESGRGGMVVPNLDNSLVSWWRMDDANSTMLFDYIGRYNATATTAGAVKNSSGKFGNSERVNGTSYFTITNQSGPILEGTGAFTVSFWFKCNSGGDGFILSKGTWNTGPDGFGIWARSDLGRGIEIDTLYGHLEGYTGNVSGVFDGNWHHVAWTYDGSGNNKAVLDTKDSWTTGSGKGTWNIPAGNLYLSGYARGLPASGFKGSLDEVMIFNRSLSTDEIRSLYNATAMNFNKSFAEGAHNYTAYVGNIYGNVNSSSSTFTVDLTAPSITNVVSINASGVSGGTVVHGDSVTINATVTGITGSTGSVWAKIWQGLVGTSAVIWQGFLNFVSGNLWSVNVVANNSFPISLVNYTVYANDSAGNMAANYSSNFTVLNSPPVMTSTILSTTNPLTNDTNQNLIVAVNSTDYENHNITYAYNWYKNGTLNATTLISSGLVAYYPLDYDTLDYLGSNDGTNNGATLNSSGKVGGAYNFNGSGRYLDMTNTSSLSIISNLTISAWFYSIKDGQTGSLVSRWNYGDVTNCQYALGIAGTSTVYFYIGNGVGNIYTNCVTSNNAFTSNSWNHVVAVYNPSNSLNIYVNGILVKYSNTGVPASNNNIARPLFIGADYPVNSYFNGSIDEVMIFNRSLSASEVSQLYYGGLNGGTIMPSSQLSVGDVWNVIAKAGDFYNWSSTLLSNNVTIMSDALYPQFSNYSDNNATLAVSGIGLFNVTVLNTNGTVILNINNTNITATSLGSNNYSANYSFTSGGSYNYQWFAYGNGTTHNFNVSATRNYFVAPPLNVTINSPANNSYFNYTTILFNVTSSESGTGFVVPNLDNSLVSWWRMDDNVSTTVIDYMGRNNGSVVGGATQNNSGKFGKSFSFDGSSGLINLSSLPISGTQSFTVSSWIKTTSTGTRKQIVSFGSLTTNQGFWFFINTGNRIEVDLSNVAGPTSSTTVTDGNWHFVCANNNAGVIQIYLDGVASGSPVTMSPNIQAGSQVIGKSLLDYGTPWYFGGAIDEVMIFNRSLNASEILSLYNATAMNFYNTLSESSHSYTVYVGNVYGNINSSRVTFGIDNTYPGFSNYQDNNNTLNDVGLGLFNVTVLNTNGTVWLEINGVNVTATNSTYGGNIYNANYSFTSGGTYTYQWFAYGNGTTHNLNVSATRNYFMNATPLIGLSAIYPLGDLNASHNNFFNVTVNVSCLQGYCGTSNVSLVVNYSTNYSCYQETANVSTSCGGLSTGNYSNVGNYFYIDYSKPLSALNSSVWQVKYGYSGTDSYLLNLTINASCWNASNDKISFRMFSIHTAGVSFNSSIQCWNGASWIDMGPLSSSDSGFPYSISGNAGISALFDGGWDSNRAMVSGSSWSICNSGKCLYGAIYEEAMWWKFNTYLVNTTAGAIPFYTNASTNPLTTSALNVGQSQLITFWVNATGTVGMSYPFASYVNSTSNLSISNLTNIGMITISNSLPVVTLVSPADGSLTTNRTPTFTWSGSDIDGDSLTYEINITAYTASGNTYVSGDDRYVGSLTNTNYTPTSDLKYLYDNNYYYKWQVRAYDGVSYGSWTTSRIINISAIVSMNLINSSVNFGLKNISYNLVYQDNTSDDSPYPIVVENNGTVKLNVSVNSTQLFLTSPTASSSYQFKVNNLTGFEGAFNWLKSLVSWTNMPLTGNVVAIDELNYSGKNRARLDLAITVPQGEPGGNRSASITVVASLGE